MKYYGKEKCRILKEIRAEIARANDIEWVVSECKHQGNCKGTCPKCEAEVRQLEAALARREALGKAVAVAGIAAGIAVSVTGCDDFLATGGTPLDGDMPVDGGMLPPVETTAEKDTGEACTEVEFGEYPEPDTVPVKGEEIPIPGEPAEPDTVDETTMGAPLPEEET
jgi:hypothetical protein